MYYGQCGNGEFKIFGSSSHDLSHEFKHRVKSGRDLSLQVMVVPPCELFKTLVLGPDLCPRVCQPLNDARDSCG